MPGRRRLVRGRERAQRDRSESPGASSSDESPVRHGRQSRQSIPALAVPEGRRLILCLDWGTETMAMSYCTVEPGEDPTTIPLKRIKTLDHYEQDMNMPANFGTSVPVIIYYPPPNDDDPNPEPVCGNFCKRLLSEPDHSIHMHMGRVVQNMKLLLDESIEMESTRKKILKKVKVLIDDGTLWSADETGDEAVPSADQPADGTADQTMTSDNGPAVDPAVEEAEKPETPMADKIKSAGDAMFTTYLCYAIGQARRFFENRTDILKDNPKPEFVVTMPVNWSINSYHRLLKAVNTAVVEKWPYDFGDGIPMKFTVAEPVAAATFMIADHAETEKFKEGDVVMVGDAGGGTIEFLTFKITNIMPLRFEQVTKPSASSSGSVGLNTRMLELAQKKLRERKDDICEESKEFPLSGIAESQVLTTFENQTKRTTDLETNEQFPIFHLKGQDRRITISKYEMHGIFEPVRRALMYLIRSQFEQCRKEGLNVSYLIMAGSFSDNDHVGRWVTEQVEQHSKTTKVLRNEHIGSAVTNGGVLRALDKSNGPVRFLTMSAGLLRHWGKGFVSEEDKRRIKRSVVEETDYDGDKWYVNLIDWFATKGDKIRDKYGFVSTHYILPSQEEWIIEEVIYFSGEEQHGLTVGKPKITKPKITKPKAGEKAGKPKKAKPPPRKEGPVELGRLTIDFERLKNHPRLPKRTIQVKTDENIKDEEYCIIRCKVEVRMSEEYFHALTFRVTWDPELEEDDGAVYGDDDADDDMAMDWEYTRQTHIDIGSAFHLSTN